MRKLYIILFFVMLVCIGCEWHLRTSESESEGLVAVERYDRIEALYLSTGDVAALHQMNTDYSRQTQTLIENLLQLGHVNDSDINIRFFQYFQDTTLKTILNDVRRQYADMSDVDKQLSESFQRLTELMPGIPIPQVYTQISSLDQSIVVSDGMLGVSLDKYLGSDYPIYIKYGYTEHQRATMTRSYIVPDCLSFYLLSLYPLSPERDTVAVWRNQHMGRIQHVVNLVLERRHFNNPHVDRAANLMKARPEMTARQLLLDDMGG